MHTDGFYTPFPYLPFPETFKSICEGLKRLLKRF
nr:MAG TPA: hypothetical protein [Caudoviricetes sp.]